MLIFVAMVKPQSSCSQSVVAQFESSRWDVVAAEPIRAIPYGDHAGFLPLARLLGAVIGGKKIRLGAAALAIATATAISTATPALSAGVSKWSYSPETGAIGFSLDTNAEPKYFLMANPMRIVVDLPGSAVNLKAIEAQAGGVFTQIQAAKTTAGQTRLVLQLATGTVLQPGQVELTALGGGRWSLQPLLAGESVNPSQSPEFMAEAAPVVTGLSGLDESVEEPEFSLPSLEAMEAAAETKDEFVSMEETLERQRSQPRTPALVAVPQGAVPVADGSVEWGSSQLPPVPTNIAPQNLASAAVSQAPASSDSEFLPQLPQPRLGQAPLAFNPPVSSSLVDPAQIVDTRQLREPAVSFRSRPPAAVEPVIDPKLLSLDEQQSAAALGGQTGLVLNSNFAPAARRSAEPQSVPRVAVPAIAPEPVVSQPAVADDSVPFLVEFGAPLPGVAQ